MPIYNTNDYIRLMRPLPQSVERDVFGIPYVDADDINIDGINYSHWLINMNNARADDKNADKKIVHSFCYDKHLLRAYNNPINYLHRVSRYYAVATFDFSMHKGMDFRHILAAIYDNRWIGAFMQTHGKKVIPTVGWVHPDENNICFAGLRNGGTFMISTLGVNNSISRSEFITGYNLLRERFPDSQLICLGNKIDGMDSDVCFVSYADSFGNWDKYPGYCQRLFISGNGTVTEGVK